MTQERDSLVVDLPRGSDASPRVVAILCHNGWAVRNVIHSGLLEKLRARGVTAVLAVGESVDRDSLRSAGIHEACAKLLKPPQVGSVRGKASLNALLRASFARRYHISSYAIFQRWFGTQASLWERCRNVVVDLLAIIGCRDPWYDWQIAHLNDVFRRTRDLEPVRNQLRALAPALVVSTSCVASVELPYIESAKELGIPTLGWILSFDNLTSRSVLPTFDHYAVWNDRMSSQVLRYYPDRDPQRVRVTGTPQFDFHVRSDIRWDRASTLARLGLDASDRYILYAANASLFTPSEPELVAQFAVRCRETGPLQRHRVVVRPHPLDDHGRWKSLSSKVPGVVVSNPTPETSNGGASEGQALLVNTLREADACVTMASTMSLDAAIVDTPVVCIAFAGERGGEEDRFCREVYDAEHYRPIARSGGVRVARDMDELVSSVLRYVQDPELDRAARAGLVKRECGKVDGLAADRVADLIASIVGQPAVTLAPRSAVCRE